MTSKPICQNKKAYHDYHIEETIEAGIALIGNEVKSLRLGRANLKDSYAIVRGNEVYLVNTHISPYSHADSFNAPEPTRTRKLLLHKKEITRLIGKTREKGFTLNATKMYFVRGKVKVQIALAKGKKLYDKRESIKEKDQQRELQRIMKSKRNR